MVPIIVTFYDTELVFHVGKNVAVPIELRDVMGTSFSPTLVQDRSCVSHSCLVSTAIADEDDVFEAMLLEALTDILKDHLKGLLAKANTP